MANTSSNLPAVMAALPTVKSQPELSQALARLNEKFNVLVPAQMNFSSPMHKVALEAVQLDATVDDKKNGIDVYSPDGGDRYTLHYKAANKIAGAAGINWTNSAIVRRDLGDDGRVIFVEFSVEWRVKRANGSTRKGATTGFYRFEEDRKKFSNPKQLESRRRFAEALAESNAKLRAIFEALDQLPRHFTLAELRKPFLVPCVVEDVSELAKDDPEIKRMIVAHSLGITNQVYGPRQAPAAAVDPKMIQGGSVEVVDEKIDQATGEVKLSEKEYKSAWLQSPSHEQLSEIEKLIKAKSYAVPAGSKAPSALTPNERAGYLWFLYCLPDPKPAEQRLPYEGGE